MKIVNLPTLNQIMNDSWVTDHKFFTILDYTEKVEIFFKYHGVLLDIMDDQFAIHQKYGELWLKMAKLGGRLIFNFSDLNYISPFTEEWFPEEALNTENYNNDMFTERYRLKFPNDPELKERSFFPKDDLRLVFLFKKNNIPPVLLAKTMVLEVYNGEEYFKKLDEVGKLNNKEETKEEVKEAPNQVNTKKTLGRVKPAQSTSIAHKVEPIQKTPVKTKYTTTVPAKSTTSTTVKTTATTSAKPTTIVPAKTIAKTSKK